MVQPSIARYLKRHRHRLTEAVARPLEPALGSEIARTQARQLVIGLERAFLSEDATAFLVKLHESLARWSADGVCAESVAEAMLALVRSRPAEGSTHPSTDALSPLRPFMDFVPTPMLYVDPAFRVLHANAAFCALTREAPEALRGVSVQQLMAPESRDAIQRFAERGDGSLDAMQLGHVRLAACLNRPVLASRVPISPQGEYAGCFLLFSTEAPEWIPETSFSELLAREKRQKEKFAALLTVSNAVVNTLDLDAILSTIAKQVREVIQTDECTVFLFDEKLQELYPVVCDAMTYVHEMMAVRLKLGEGITGMVAQTGRGEIVNDAEADPRAVTVPGTPPEQTALLCVPLLTPDRVIGVITLTRIGVRGFGKEDLELATLFAGQCSAAIVNARLYEDMKGAYHELREAQTQLVQSAKLNALGEMAGGVAHDFNNILAAILGRTQLLLQTTDDSEVRRQLGVIEQAALDGAHTVRRVQEFTRLRQDERFETLDVNQVLLGVLELTRPAWEAGAKRRGVVIDVHLELHATQPTPGNASELREVFTNLVLNAVDAMPAGGDLWVRSENGPGVLQVEVRDTGVGMTLEVAAKIFDPFFTTKEVKGTGLGLSVAYGIVSRHKGTIAVQSDPGVGTVFTLTFPVGIVDRPEKAVDTNAPLARLQILVVDDEEPVLQVMADLLTAMGHSVSTAHGGPMGVELLDKQRYDVVFSDLGMPEVNGWDLALAAKSRHPNTAVVLVSGWGFQLEEETVAQRGVDLVLAKPFSWEDVAQALRQVTELLARVA